MTGIKPSIAPSGENQEVRRNKPTFDFIVSKGLWHTEGIRNFFNSSATITFPSDSIEIKAHWKIIQEADKGRYHWNIDGRGRLLGLTALHIISKIIPNWTWATFEHADNLGRCDVIGCADAFGAQQPFIAPSTKPDQPYSPCVPTDRLLKLFASAGLDAAIWRNYCLKGSQTEFRTAAGVDTRLGNSQVEHDFMATSSCMTCHVRAFAGPAGENVYGAGFKGRNEGYIGPPELSWFFVTTTNLLTRKGVQADFIWAVPFCASSLFIANGNCFP
jgi:hypothetical protein